MTIVNNQPASEPSDAEKAEIEARVAETRNPKPAPVNDMATLIELLTNLIRTNSRMAEAIIAAVEQAGANSSTAQTTAQTGPAQNWESGPSISVKGMDLSIMEDYNGHYATYNRGKNDYPPSILAPVELAATPLAELEMDDGSIWCLVPMRKKSGEEQMVVIRLEQDGGSVSPTFESEYEETFGLEMAFFNTWANVTGWEKSENVVAREKARKQASSTTTIQRTSTIKEEPF